MNIFMQMFRIRARLRKLPRLLGVREIEEGLEEKTLWLLRHTKWIECVSYVFVSWDKLFCCVGDLLFEIGILNSGVKWDLNSKLNWSL